MDDRAAVVATTERLVIRPWTEHDAEALLDIYSRGEVARWLGAEPQALQTLDQAVRRVERWASRAEADPTYRVWCLTLRASGVPVGTVLLLPLAGGEVEVGWHLHPNHWGHGYATEAARAAIARGIDAGLDQVLAVVKPDNHQSQAVCRRLGMEHVGLTDRYYGMPIELFRTGTRRPSLRHWSR